MATPVLNLRYNILSISGSSPNFTLDGLVFDETGNFNGTNAAVNDEIFDFNGNRYRIASFTTQTTSHITCVVNDYRLDGTPSTGNGVIFRPSTNFKFPVSSRQTNQVSEYLNNFIIDQAIQQIDAALQATTGAIGIPVVEAITLTGTNITNKYVDLAHVPIVPSNTEVDLIGGSAQQYSLDFTVIDNGLGAIKRLNWNTLGMDGLVISGSMLRVYYSY